MMKKSYSLNLQYGHLVEIQDLLIYQEEMIIKIEMLILFMFIVVKKIAEQRHAINVLKILFKLMSKIQQLFKYQTL